MTVADLNYLTISWLDNNFPPDPVFLYAQVCPADKAAEKQGRAAPGVDEGGAGDLQA